MLKLFRGPCFMICNTMQQVLGSKYNTSLTLQNVFYRQCLHFFREIICVTSGRRAAFLYVLLQIMCLVGKVRLDVPLERKRKKPFKKKRRRKKKETVLPDSFINEILKLLAFSDIIWLYDIIDVCDMLFFPTK